MHIPADRPTGFTLIELLVVVSIIALLISILLPALGEARETAVRMTCVSNVRAQGMVIRYYTNDYRGGLPYHSGDGSGNSTPWSHTHHSMKLDQREMLVDKYSDGDPWIWICPKLTIRGVAPERGYTGGGLRNPRNVVIGRSGGYAQRLPRWRIDTEEWVSGNPRTPHHTNRWAQVPRRWNGGKIVTNHIDQLLPDSVIISEQYIGPNGGWGYGPGKGWFGDIRHEDSPLRPGGGSHLQADGSAFWGTGMYLWYNSWWISLPE